jgi:hypothetical protein
LAGSTRFREYFFHFGEALSKFSAKRVEVLSLMLDRGFEVIMLLPKVDDLVSQGYLVLRWSFWRGYFGNFGFCKDWLLTLLDGF